MQPALAPAPHPAMQDQHKNPNHSVQDPADQVFQEQLLAAQLHAAQQQVPPPRPQPSQAGAPQLQPASAVPRDHHNIDPAISGTASGMIQAPVTPTGLEETSPDGRKIYGKRELSTSKRAAQNRAAQRAFRQRKESYIRKLEEQVKDYEILQESLKSVQAENYQLREYIINLQSRLIDSQNEVPELPGNIDLNQPRSDPSGLPTQTGGSSGQNIGSNQQAQSSSGGEQGEQVNALNRIAVAGLGMRNKHQHEEAAFLGGQHNFSSKRMRSEGEQSQEGSPQVSKAELPQNTS